jgi:hypothetical protein
VRKQEVTKKVIDRVAPAFSNAVGTVLLKIIGLTKVPDWKTSHIEGFYSTPTTNQKLGWLVRLERHTVRRAIKKLLHEGLITPSTSTRNSYIVNTDRISGFRSTYRASLAHVLGEKILNAVRMKFHRHPDRQPAAFASIHPLQDGKCKCEGSFCSHPTAENIEDEPVAVAA